MRKVLTLVSLTLLFAVALVSARSLVHANSKAKTSAIIQQTNDAVVENSEASAESTAAARCPNIHKAVGALETALHDLEVANHDFCGHKAEAMEQTRHAIEQLKRAEECEKCR